jgi:GT2 family glycosyltransferase
MIDVVLLAYNFNEDFVQLTESAIYSLRQEKMGRLIIVDNASTVRAGMLREESDTYIRNKTNIGYPAAVNQGFSLVTSDYAAIANNDIRVSPNWAEVAGEILKDPEVGSVHFKMVLYDEPFGLGNNTWITGKERWCSSSFFVVRTKTFIEVGGYDLAYKEGGYDDWDFWHRVRHINGWKTAYTNKAAYQHRDSSTYLAMDDGRDRVERDMKNREIFKSKFGDYAEDIWNKKYPEQMAALWRPFP